MKKQKALIVLFTYVLYSIVTHSSVSAQEWCWMDMVNDPTAAFSVSSTNRPNYLEPMKDPVFMTIITRITGDPGTPIITKDGSVIGTWGDAVKYHYSKDQPWNADSSLINLPRNNNGSPSGLFLDGNTYEVLFALKIPGDDRWHPTDPSKRFYVKDNKFGTVNVYTKENKVLRTFSECRSLTLGPYEGNISHDAKRVAFQCQKADGHYYAFAFDIDNNKKNAEIYLGASELAWISISPSGKYIVCEWGDTDSKIYNATSGAFVAQMAENISHFDMGYSISGEESAAGVSKPEGNGTLVMIRLSDGVATWLNPGFGPKDVYSSHSSCRNNELPGWVYSYWSNKRPIYKDEIVSTKMDGSGDVRRFCHTHNNKVDYVSEVQPVPARDGKRVMFSSNWGEIDGRPVGTYIVDARIPCENGNNQQARPNPPTNLRILAIK